MLKRIAKNKREQAAQKEQLPVASKLISLETFADQLDWHVESVRRACRQNRIQAIKLGRGWRVPSEVAEHIMKNGIPRPQF